ncbi:MAG: hypothetical protein ABSF98_23810 [Bryobacteraceae bacterium]|jgi:hypothetical protein
MTSTLTVAGGLVVYGATQLAQRFWLDPVTEAMKALGRASYVFVYYADVYRAPGIVREELTAEASKELRMCGAELKASLTAVRSYWAFRMLRQLPPRDSMERVASLFIGLSNAKMKEDARDARKEADELKTLLGV